MSDLPFVCRRCHGELRPASPPALVCAACEIRFPVVETIPRFVPADTYAASFGFQWNRHARTQIDRFNGYRFSHERFFAVTGWPTRLHGERILEAGCGAGRFTEVALETGATVHAFDYSNAVDANLANNGGGARLQLFQASIFDIPLPAASFERIFCFGVLQHTPDPERAFRALVPFLKPGGSIAIDVYKKHWQTVLNTKYLLRPFTRRMDMRTLHDRVERWTPPLVRAQDRIRGLIGAKLAFGLVPVSSAPWPGLRSEDRLQWCVLDTFDMYAPAHDHPQTIGAVRRWMREAQLVDVEVEYGPNGINARGRKPQ